MAQADLGTLIAAQTSGGELAVKLRSWRDATHSLHSGATRPSYAVAGTLWLNTSTTPWRLMVFTGSVDSSLMSITPSTGAVVIPAATVGLGNVNNTADSAKPVSTAQQTAINGRLATTGGSLTGNLTMSSANVAMVRGAQTRTMHNDGTNMGFLGNDGNWDIRWNDAGALWTAELGDLNSRINTQAAAYANSAVADRIQNLGAVSGLYLSGNDINFPVLRNTGNADRFLATMTDALGRWGLRCPSSGGSIAITSAQHLDFLWNGSQIFYRLDGNPYVAFGNGASDAQLKDVHETITDGLDRILSLAPVEYEFRPNEFLSLPEGDRRGFTAQNLEEHYPTAVITQRFPSADKDAGTYMGLSQDAPMQLIADLVSSVQTLNAKIGALTDRVTALEAA